MNSTTRDRFREIEMSRPAISGRKNFLMDTVYCRANRPITPGALLRPAVFLDRDGVINEDTHYLHRAEDVRFIPGALEAVAEINGMGVPVVLVTNQAGIGRGYYGWQEFDEVQKCVEGALASVGGWFDAVWACAYNPEGAEDKSASYYRKPNPGMLEGAAVQFGLALRTSWLAGDRISDIEAAINAGLRGSVHVLTGYGCVSRDEVRRLARKEPPVGRIHFCDSLRDMVPLLRADTGSAGQEWPIANAPCESFFQGVDG